VPVAQGAGAATSRVRAYRRHCVRVHVRARVCVCVCVDENLTRGAARRQRETDLVWHLLRPIIERCKQNNGNLI
jgi:hypothetical protein